MKIQGTLYVHRSSLQLVTESGQFHEYSQNFRESVQNTLGEVDDQVSLNSVHRW